MTTGNMGSAVAMSYEDMLFLQKNKAYGAYILRRNKNRNTSIAVFIACFAFISAVSWPLFVKQGRIVSKNHTCNKIVVEFTDLTNPPKDPIVIQGKTLPDVAMIKFVAPTILPEDKNLTEWLPTTEELGKAHIGTITQTGSYDPTVILTNAEGGNSEVVETPPEEETVREIFQVDELPAFPGGEAALLEYIAAHVRYPDLAIRAGIEGVVAISFVVDKEGNVKNATVQKAIGGGCEEEALRVVNNLPSWHPGKQNGHPVKVRVNIPIRFTLHSGR